MTDRFKVVPPGGTIGIVGGGQLGRMAALCAAAMGYRCHIFCPDTDSPAAQVSAKATVASYDDADALDRFAASVDVITYEFENLPTASFAQMDAITPVRPHWRCLETTQHRVTEKDFINALGISTAPYRQVTSADELDAALDALGRPAVLKTTRMGYDGKGQVMIGPDLTAQDAWDAMGGGEGILEGYVDFEREVSAIVARGLDGSTACFDVVDNVHQNHILAETRAPSTIPPALAERAQEIACKLSDAFDMAGLLAVEMFVTTTGELLVNELAARPHNSGHWTIDACHASQFEQFIRAVAGLPLGDPSRHSDAVMENLLGDGIDAWASLLAEPNAKLHLYGKAEARPGRKMGHVTRVFPKS
ncbi:MAG: 5-(carboxyamino)imidazole ribonucleotide synthase [Alphaproteobacteria bacterium]|jgi:5-(carboxyamino)imidazole ribonucleotide synthase|nr:5-(carboxyamino)imidazole ribonucleotide synthase [Rhodospirillaceae bacterium]MDG2480073.1 5-(carboxyamino)imidazole ribonucleotide synthase [Alphaproteobacteria bacterium]